MAIKILILNNNIEYTYPTSIGVGVIYVLCLATGIELNKWNSIYEFTFSWLNY